MKLFALLLIVFILSLTGMSEADPSVLYDCKKKNWPCLILAGNVPSSHPPGPFDDTGPTIISPSQDPDRICGPYSDPAGTICEEKKTNGDLVVRCKGGDTIVHITNKNPRIDHKTDTEIFTWHWTDGSTGFFPKDKGIDTITISCLNH